MRFDTFFSRQARKPDGWFGRWVMSGIFNIGNARSNRFVYDLLAPQAGDRILEVGCGTGALIANIAGKVDGCIVEGIDFSDTMVSVARRNNQKRIAAGRVFIHRGDFDGMPVQAETLTKICSVNTIYFWPDPESTAQKMARLLKPGGMLVLGYADIDHLKQRRLDTDIFRFYAKPEVERLLFNAGFTCEVRTRSIGNGASAFHCTVALK